MTYPYPGPYGPPPVFTPQPQVRPNVGWIVLAWTLAFVISACTVVFGLFSLMTTVIGGLVGPPPAVTFSGGQSVTVELDPAERPGFYRDMLTPFDTEQTCSVAGGTTDDAVKGPMAYGEGLMWERILEIKVPAAGEYQVTCAVTAGEATRFSVAMATATPDRTLPYLLIFGVPGVCVAGATTATVLIARRRAAHRRELGIGSPR
ncbi:hypothetical protein [Nonomuraea sp. NPDC046570]|uniref:hypothetical protein n=1 Tax=Nonomuraea sp. NPDC046570 TaxID=3155255 RepID=UPI0033EB3861